MPQVYVKIVRLRDSARLPEYQTQRASGADLCANVTEPVVIAPWQCELIPTGIAVAIPPGYEAQVRPRSGLSTKHRLLIPNSPGTIDSDYRGEVHVPLLNAGTEPFTVEAGMRIAQLVICPVVQASWIQARALDDTLRGKNGFGSTGD